VLTVVGSTLYGTAGYGGASGDGTIFSEPLGGGAPTVLYSFTGNSDGANPEAVLILSGSTLYGTASSGGVNGDGTVFALQLTETPEPISMIFFGTGLVGVIGYVARWRRR
jgi:uncharacterized repeat protein (TIGR03803 family)